MSKISIPTLNLYHSNPEFLFDFLQPHLDVNVKLLEKEDEDEYKKLLKTSVVFNTKKSFPQIKKEHQQPIPEKDTCLDIAINRVIAILVKRTDEKSTMNVMRFGFIKPRAPNSQGFSLTALNSMVDYMRKSRSWLKFYTRISENAMIFLLTNFSIFLELQNGCYVQLAGPAINKLLISSNFTHFKYKKEISVNAHVFKKQTASGSACAPSNTQNSLSSTSFSSQNEEVGTQNVCTSYQGSDRSHNLSQNSLPDENVGSISQRKSEVLAFFKKLREEEDKAYSKSYISDDNSVLFSQDTEKDIVSDHIEQKIGNRRMVSTFTKQETGDMTSYTRFKEQTKGVFLKILETMYPAKVTGEASSHDKVVECSVSDKNKNTETQKKRIIEDVQDSSSKAIILNNRDAVKMCVGKAPNSVDKRIIPNENNKNNQMKRSIEDIETPSLKAIVLNNRDVVKVPSPNSISNLCFSRSAMFLSSLVYNKNRELWYGLPKDHKY
ncbi:telomerase reverse transcriptase-like [Rhizophagus clarus]|uniref:Telomerase reverse transcriptase n=1 Tax=Rhizophagus clarus TaxID=94130 RepID=A0A8H3KV84_9GLOM|nr:telomerase reverse transcriptase-like [Rhizophagus clarus]